MNQIIRVKFPYRAALDLWDPGRPFSAGMTISLLQDAVEAMAHDVAALGGECSGGCGGTETVHFSPTSPEAFDGIVRDLAAAGKEQQRRQAVAQLAHDLAAYCGKVEAQRTSGKQVHDKDEKILATARHDLAVERSLDPKSFQASQVRFRIGQLAFQLDQIRVQADRAVATARGNIGGFDTRLAEASCATVPHASWCDELAAAQQQYASVRARVLSVTDQIEADTHQSATAMTALNKEAGN